MNVNVLDDRGSPSDAARIARAEPGPRELMPGDALAARFRIMQAVVALLHEVARSAGGAPRVPVVIVLEDVHAADVPSLLLLQLVAVELAPAQALVIATARDAGATMPAEARQALDRAAAAGRSVPLGRLRPDAVATLVRELRADVPAATIDAIQAATQGNPLFVEGLVRALPAGALELPRAVPSSLREAIAGRVHALGAEARALVEVVAVIGDDAPEPRVARVAGLTPARASGLCGEAVAAGVLAERARERYGFVHGLVRDAVYRGLDDARREALHAKAAEALASAPGATPPWAEIAHHLIEAGPERLSAAVDASVRAAEGALAALAYEDAIALVQRALERAQHDRRARAELLLAEGLARARADDARRGAALCAQAAELARALGDPALFARAALGYGADFTFGSTDRVLVRLLEEALAGLPADDVTLRAHVLARLAAALQPAADPAVPVRMAREAIALARGLDDDRARLVVTHAAMSALVDFVPADQRIAHDLEVERLALAAGDRPRVMRARARLTFDHLELAAIEAAEASFEGYTRLAAELRWGRALWHAPLFRSMRAALEGRFSQTGPALVEAAAMAEAAGDPTRRWVFAMHRFGLHRTAERHDALLALEPEVRVVFAGAPAGETWTLVTIAGILTRAGRVEEARAVLARGDRGTMLAQSDLVTLGVAAEVAAATRDAPLAAALYERLAPLSGRLMAYGIMAVFCEGPYDRLLGLLASALGHHDEAERHFEAAVALCRRLGLAPHLARALHEHALALATRDRARATALAGEALTIARTLDMVGLVGAIERAGVSVGMATSPVKARPIEIARAGADWIVRWGGPELRLKDSRGLQILHRLVAEPEREIHALELAGRVDDGDAGEHLDRPARERYRARLADLDEAAREAEANGDAERATRAREEIEALAGELARAVGLGGRDRRSASASERARVTVQKRIKDALRRIEEEAPEVARALAGSIRTGVTCCYHPGGRPP